MLMVAMVIEVHGRHVEGDQKASRGNDDDAIGPTLRHVLLEETPWPAFLFEVSPGNCRFTEQKFRNMPTAQAWDALCQRYFCAPQLSHTVSGCR